VPVPRFAKPARGTWTLCLQAWEGAGTLQSWTLSD